MGFSGGMGGTIRPRPALSTTYPVSVGFGEPSAAPCPISKLVNWGRTIVASSLANLEVAQITAAITKTMKSTTTAPAILSIFFIKLSPFFYRVNLQSAENPFSWRRTPGKTNPLECLQIACRVGFRCLRLPRLHRRHGRSMRNGISS
jgi:hypothetical protein